MPTLDFKGKNHIYAHHLTVPYRPLRVDASRSMLAPTQTRSQNEGGLNKDIPLTDQNLIIHGDNLEALKALLPQYAGRVKCIYIDPPYNTGNEGWVYNDNVNSPMMRDWFEKKSPVDGEDLERHDKWLCMMWPRLHLLRELLRDDGVIFVSIDDNEAHHLRMMMDEIFGEQNFVGSLVVIRAEGGGLAKQVVKGHDHLLVFAKNINSFEPLKRPKDIRGKRIIRDDIHYWIEEDWLRREFGKYGTLYYEDVLEVKGKQKKKEIDIGLKNGNYVLIKKGKGKTVVGRYRRIGEDWSKFYSVLKHLNADGKNKLKQILDENSFSFPKPVSLVKQVVLGATAKTSIPEQNRTEQNRTEQNRTEQNRTEQNRTEQNRTENIRSFRTRHHSRLIRGQRHHCPRCSRAQQRGWWQSPFHPGGM